MTHLAKKYDFQTLHNGLMEHVRDGWIHMQENGPLQLFNYTKQTGFTKKWNDFTLSARGLILNIETRRVQAWCIPKFFNYGEMTTSLPNEPFKVYTKYDGSMGICYFYNGEWHVATRGSFDSDQAVWATNYLHAHPNPMMDIKITYIVEIIYVENKIVVDYDGWEGLVFLAAYRDGEEVSDETLSQTAISPYKPATQHNYKNIDDILALCQKLPVNEEGFVIKFENNLRIKIKGEAYIRLHRIISNITPLAIWGAMVAGDNIEKVKSELPEEFLVDYDRIVGIIKDQERDWYKIGVNALAEARLEVGNERKHIAEYLKKWFEPRVRAIAFQLYAELSEATIRKNIFKNLRPTGNKLNGYVPTSGVSRFLSMEEDA